MPAVTSSNATTGLPQHPSSRSPLPYLVGGLAAMFGLIGFALLTLACSYWKLSGRFDNNDLQSDIEGGGKPLESVRVCNELNEKIVVVMAGDQKPRFIATPTWSEGSCFHDCKPKAPTENRASIDGTVDGERRI